MTRILLCGAFGQDNPGDEALLDSFVAALATDELLVTTTEPDVAGFRAIEPTVRGVMRAFRDVDAVVVGGGTIFKTLHPAAGRHPLALLARTWLLQAAARTRRIPFALVGVGAGRAPIAACRSPLAFDRRPRRRARPA